LVVATELHEEVTVIVAELPGGSEPWPHLIMLEGVPSHRMWPRCSRPLWPAGSLKPHRQFMQRAPTANLDG
jgi:hypothetical protein